MYKKVLQWYLLIMIAGACDNEEPEEVCKVIKAKSGYGIGGALTYDLEYQYVYNGSVVTEVKTLSLQTNEKISTTNYDYDSEGRIISEITAHASGFVTRVYHQYASKVLTTTTYILNGPDTVSVTEIKDYYSHGGDRVHRAQHSNISLNIVDGNVVLYGSYTVDGSDTTDSFVEEYTYDQNENYYQNMAYRAAIPSDFAWAKLVSKNNLIRAEYIGGGWTKSYTNQYDEAGRLTRHVGAAGITVDFEYLCD